MSPSLVCALLWLWEIDSSERGLFDQILMAFGLGPMDLKLDHPMAVIMVAKGLVGAGLGVINLTSAIRSIPEHLFHAAKADSAGPLAVVWLVILPTLRWLLSCITRYQSLALRVSFNCIFLTMGPARSTVAMAMRSYSKTRAPQIGAGAYAFGSAIALIVSVIGVVVALVSWRFTDMKALLPEPRIEVTRRACLPRCGRPSRTTPCSAAGLPSAHGPCSASPSRRRSSCPRCARGRIAAGVFAFIKGWEG